MKKCTACNLINEDGASRCDCGHRFGAPLPKRPLRVNRLPGFVSPFLVAISGKVIAEHHGGIAYFYLAIFLFPGFLAAILNHPLAIAVALINWTIPVIAVTTNPWIVVPVLWLALLAWAVYPTFVKVREARTQRALQVSAVQPPRIAENEKR